MTDKKNNQKQRLSLVVIVSLFTVIMATSIMAVVIKNKNNSIDGSMDNVEYGKINNINPILLEDAELKTDKTSSNIDLINEIKRVYNVNVIYGVNSASVVKTVDANPIYNADDVNDFLFGLIACLKKYPTDLIKEMQLYDYNIEIYLVDDFNNNNISLATRDSNNNFRIFLSNIKTLPKIEESVHHEIYHILEYYMKLEFNLKDLYADWTSYNPTNFSYNSDITKLNGEYVYEVSTNRSGDYFVSIYSKSSEEEDRAEIFTDMMKRETIPAYYTDNIGAIKNKVMLISKALRYCFNSLKYSTSLYWERYII